VVELVYSNGAYCLIISESDSLMIPINDRFLFLTGFFLWSG